MFDLEAANHEDILTSETCTTREAALAGIDAAGGVRTLTSLSRPALCWRCSRSPGKTADASWQWACARLRATCAQGQSIHRLSSACIEVFGNGV